MRTSARARVRTAERTAPPVPAQWVAKLHTELLGRLPSQREWADDLAELADAGPSLAALRRHAARVAGSAELARRGYDETELVLVLTRALLNRDPAPAELEHGAPALRAAGVVGYAEALLRTPEFADGLVCRVLGPDPGYWFGRTPAPVLPTAGDGLPGDEATVRKALSRARKGTVVALAPRALLRLTSPLEVPSGVTLTTAGEHGPRSYARMARVVPAGPLFGALVVVHPGAVLRGVWVDGQRGNPRGYVAHEAYNVESRGGEGTTVESCRVGNTAGGTNIAMHGRNQGWPSRGCLIRGNLVDGYSSDHHMDAWCDGISVAAEDVLVEDNEVVDCTDVGIITFAVSDDEPQHSLVRRNTVLNAGNSSYAAYGMDPYFSEDPSAERSCEGMAFTDNVLWTGPRSHVDLGLTVGTRAWFGEQTHPARGGSWTGNTTGVLTVRAHYGIGVSGVDDLVVTGNTVAVEPLPLLRAGAPAAVAADLSRSSGQIQDCVDGPLDSSVVGGCPRGYLLDRGQPLPVEVAGAGQGGWST